MRRGLRFGIFIFLFLYGGRKAGAQMLPEAFAADPELRCAAVSISVKRVSDGEEVYAFRPETALIPASLLKTLTTAVALHEYGPDFTYATTLSHTGEIRGGVLYGDILIRAGGDPTIDSKYFPKSSFVAKATEAVAGRGIVRVKGNILVLEKELPRVPYTWIWEDISNYYGALAFPFNYKDNTYHIYLKSGKAGSRTDILSVNPRIPGVTFRNEVRASARGGDNACIVGGPFAGILLMEGSIPANRKKFRIGGAMPHPAAVFREEFEAVMRKRGIVVEHKIFKSPDTTLMLTHRSPSLRDIVFHINKFSVNLYAEALGKLIGEEEGFMPVKTVMDSMGIDVTGLHIADGSGLSRRSAVPARCFTDLMLRMHGDSAFRNSLPVAGRDYALERFVKGRTLLLNNVRAKTGSLSGVRALSGYMKNRSGEEMAFTVIVNNYTASFDKVASAIGSFLEFLYLQ